MTIYGTVEQLLMNLWWKTIFREKKINWVLFVPSPLTNGLQNVLIKVSRKQSKVAFCRRNIWTEAIAYISAANSLQTKLEGTSSYYPLYTGKWRIRLAWTASAFYPQSGQVDWKALGILSIWKDHRRKTSAGVAFAEFISDRNRRGWVHDAEAFTNTIDGVRGHSWSARFIASTSGKSSVVVSMLDPNNICTHSTFKRKAPIDW